MKNLNIILLIFFYLSCDRWDYDEQSKGLITYAPETYLTLVASDTIYSRIDSSGGKIFSIEQSPDPAMLWDTLEQAFKSITTSKQILNWWGEDSDGEILGYYYKWSSDTSWTFTDLESGVFYVPIQSELDVFSFEVKSIDNEGNMDQSPSRIVLPVKNSPPSISFRFLSNPQIADIGSDTSYTFPTRTFNWDISDLDGNETVQDIFYSLNDTCETCWTRISGDQSSITLTDIKVGENTFHVWCQDIAGAKSKIINFPDIKNVNDAQVWVVKPVQGDILIVDDYPLDNENNTLFWYSSIMDTLVGETGYSIWEIGDELPFSSTDVSANLRYFKHIFWFTAYNNTAASNDTYNSAEASLLNFVMGGGNLFINPIDFEDSTFAWFPLDSIVTLNPNGRLFPGKKLVCDFDPELNLSVSHLIAIRVKGFWPNLDQFDTNREIYHMEEPQSGDGWSGEPTVCSIGQYRLSPIRLSGKVVMLTVPLHDGYRPKLDGNGSATKFFKYLLIEEFLE